MEEAVELWLDGHSITKQGIALDYQLLQRYLSTLSKLPIRGTYFDIEINHSKDEELCTWIKAEQQAASQAGLTLVLAEPWQEKLRCLYCSCLNEVNYPAPTLLNIILSLQAQPNCTKYLLSDNTALIKALNKKNTENSLLEQSNVKWVTWDFNFISQVKQNKKQLNNNSIQPPYLEINLEDFAREDS